MEDGGVNHKNSWGGSWTEEKLEAFEKYVKAYLAIMNKRRDQYGWKLIYFDGFAGSGDRRGNTPASPLFAIAGIQEVETIVYQSAAERVLGLDMRGFDFYYFIDQSEAASAALKKRLMRIAPDSAQLEFRADDANEQIVKLAEALQKGKGQYKALVLLDPFGMQIDWSSVASLRGTGTDLWILIPSGVIINRLLDKNGELAHIAKLESFFGITEAQIRALFYENVPVPRSLFGEDEIKIQKAKDSITKIAVFYTKRLREIFKYVTDKPFEMKNSKGMTIFHFACASNNQTAIKIAGGIIGRIHK